MMAGANTASRIVIDVAPLREEQFTGIPNVVKEVARRGLALRSTECSMLFSVGDVLVDPDIVARTVEESTGQSLNKALFTSTGTRPMSSEDLTSAAGLNLHIKPPRRRFATEALFVHDLSFLSIAALHQEETVRSHLQGFREQISSTDLFFTNSQATSLDLQWYCNVPDARIEVTYLGHDIAASSVMAMRRQISRRVEPFLMVLGTIEPRKNIQLVLSWLACNPSVLATHRVIFCGREGWGPTFEQLIESHGLIDALERGRIKHLGFTSANERLALLISAEALIFPSLYEGFGLPALEAMACGTPVIASCSTSLPEVVGPDGFYFDPLSEESLGRAFERFGAEKGTGKLKKRISRLVRRSGAFSYDAMFETMMKKILANLRAAPTAAEGSALR